MSIHLHSSVHKLPATLIDFFSEFRTNRRDVDLFITFIWKLVGINSRLKVSAVREISGETNIARFLNRLIERKNPSLLRYESKGMVYANQIDRVLDRINAALYNVDGKINLKLLRSSIKSRYLMGDEISIADIVLESVFRYL